MKNKAKIAEYFYISSDSQIWSSNEKFTYESDDQYELGNYFKTKEQAQKIINSKEWKDFWAKVRAGEIGGDE